MEVLRIILSEPIISNSGQDYSITSLLISKDIKDCLLGLYNIDSQDYAIVNPYKMPNLIELYNVKSKKIDLIVKRFFSSSKEIEILKKKYQIASAEKHSFLWNERVLKGYLNSRINRYKTINPIFLRKTFENEITQNSRIDTDEFKKIATSELLEHLSLQFNWRKEELHLEWETFQITFSKCTLDSKNQVCFYGVFKTNFVPPIFIGDYTENGCGKIILLKDEAIKIKRAQSITLYFEDDFFNELKRVSNENNMDELSFSRMCIEEKLEAINKEENEI